MTLTGKSTRGKTMAGVVLWWYSRLRGKRLPPEQSVVWQAQMAEELAALVEAGEAASHVN
jgi:hypothetical protein